MSAYTAEISVVVACNDGRVVFVSVPRDATVAALESTIRSTLNSKKLSMVIEGCTPAANTMLCDVHDACKRADGSLYVAVRGEKSMGSSMATCCFANDSC